MTPGASCARQPGFGGSAIRRRCRRGAVAPMTSPVTSSPKISLPSRSCPTTSNPMVVCSYKKRFVSSLDPSAAPLRRLDLRGDAAHLVGDVAGQNVFARDFARRADLVASEHGARARDVFQDAARTPLRKIVGDERDGAGAADDRKRRELSSETLFDEAERGAAERERRESVRRERFAA